MANLKKIKELQLRIKEVKNFWYLQEESDLLYRVWESDKVQDLIDNIYKIREAVEAMLLVCKKFPIYHYDKEKRISWYESEGVIVDNCTSKNKELFFNKKFKRLSSNVGCDDVLLDLSSLCESEAYQIKKRGGDLELSKFVFATSRRLLKLDGFFTDHCED